MTEKKTIACPYCGEEILAAAKKCKHCGEFLDPELRAQNQPQKEEKVVIVQQEKEKKKGGIGCVGRFCIIFFGAAIIGGITSKGVEKEYNKRIQQEQVQEQVQLTPEEQAAKEQKDLEDSRYVWCEQTNKEFRESGLDGVSLECDGSEVLTIKSELFNKKEHRDTLYKQFQGMEKLKLKKIVFKNQYNVVKEEREL